MFTANWSTVCICTHNWLHHAYFPVSAATICLYVCCSYDLKMLFLVAHNDFVNTSRPNHFQTSPLNKRSASVPPGNPASSPNTNPASAWAGKISLPVVPAFLGSRTTPELSTAMFPLRFERGRAGDLALVWRHAASTTTAIVYMRTKIMSAISR